MGVYCYTYLIRGSGRKKGVVDADSLGEAKEKLRSQGVLVTQIWAKGAAGRREALVGQSRVTFTMQLAQLVAGGMPVFESLLALQDQSQGERYHRTLVSLCDQIREGSSLSSALARFPRSFDTLYTAMVASGEASGTLGTVLRRLADLLARQLSLRKQLIGALTYPAIIASFCLVVTYLMLTFTIPSIATLIGDRQLNPFTDAVLGISRFLNHYWWLYLPLLIFVAVTSTLYMRSVKGRLFWKNMQLHLPLIGTILIRSALARFCRTLSTLQEGGLALIDSLRLARGVMLNPILEQKILDAESRIIEGSSLSTQLAHDPLIPRLVSRMVAVGEESGGLTAMLEQIAMIYEGDVERFLTRLTTFLQPALLLVMGAIIGLIMLAVLLPLTDIGSML